MQCNIDSKGKALRLTLGFAQLAAASALTVLSIAGVLPGGWWWALVGGVAAGGAFCVYEGWSGWCAVRAMGFKTPI
ncbi:MAG: hypothetical protein AAGE65_03695 [Planctomycetota bacterium]